MLPTWFFQVRMTRKQHDNGTTDPPLWQWKARRVNHQLTFTAPPLHQLGYEESLFNVSSHLTVKTIIEGKHQEISCEDSNVVPHEVLLQSNSRRNECFTDELKGNKSKMSKGATTMEWCVYWFLVLTTFKMVSAKGSCITMIFRKVGKRCLHNVSEWIS